MRTIIVTAILAIMSYQSVGFLMQQNVVKNIQLHNQKIEIAMNYKGKHND